MPSPGQPKRAPSIRFIQNKSKLSPQLIERNNNFRKLESQIKDLRDKLLSQQPDATRGRLTPSQEIFSTIVDNIGQELHLLETEIDKHYLEMKESRFLRHIFIQLEQSYKHIRLETRNGVYPFQASLEFLEETLGFLKSFTSKQQPLRIPKMDYGGLDVQAYAAKLLQEDKTYLDETLTDPMKTYLDFREKLTQDPNAPCEQFRQMIEMLIIELSDKNKAEAILEHAQTDVFFSQMLQDALDNLDAVRRKDFPYLDSVNAVERAIAVFDVFNRGKPGGVSPPLYHNLRWRYHAHSIKGIVPEYIILPTMQELDVTMLMKVRGAPLGLIGVLPGINIYADGHWQTPLEFWFHDFNHSRRMYDQHKLVAQERAEFLHANHKDPNIRSMTLDEYKKSSTLLDDYSKYCSDFLRDNVAELFTTKNEETDESRYLRSVQRMILFEIVHEEALPADPYIIAEALERKSGDKTRFFLNELQKADGKVQYTLDPAVSILAFVFRKLESDFYDSPMMRVDAIAPEGYRTREFVQKAALDLFDRLGLDKYMKEKPSEMDFEEYKKIMSEYVMDDTGFPQGFRRHILELVGDSTRTLKVEPLRENKNIMGFNEQGAVQKGAGAEKEAPKHRLSQ